MGASKPTTEEQISSLWSLGGQSIPQLARDVWERLNRDDVLGRAGQLAYNFFLSIFPLLLFLISVFGLLANRGTELRNQLFNALGEALPPAAFRLTSQTVNEIIASSGGGKTLFGALFFLWSATTGTVTMMSVVNGAYRVYDSRPWYKVRAISLGLTLCLCVLVVVGLTVVLFGGQLAGLLGAKVGAGSVVLVSWKVVQWILALLALSLSFSLVYYFGPDVEEQHWHWITPGSVVGVLLWFLSSLGFRAYLHFFNNYTKTYGSLGTVIILLLWFYVTGLAFLLGAEINASIEYAAAQRGHPEAKAEGEKKAA
jgi:membrane protein